MELHITRLNGIGGAAGFAQSQVAKVAHGLGFREMGVYKIPEFVDDDNELNHRMDGIISSLSQKDVVVFQYPSWCGDRYEKSLLWHIKAYPGAKAIIFLQDIEPLQLDPERTTLPVILETLNIADGMILPSPKMFEVLKEAGLRIPESKIAYQQVWDYPTENVIREHSFLKELLFPGEPRRFPFLNSYEGKTPIRLYSSTDLQQRKGQNVVWQGLFTQRDLFFEMGKGGFGLVWSDEDYFGRYYCMNQPYKLGCFLAAGIPVVIRKGTSQEEWIKRNKLGLVVSSLEEADDIIQNMDETTYMEYCRGVEKVQSLSVRGLYTQRALTEAVIRVTED